MDSNNTVTSSTTTTNRSTIATSAAPTTTATAMSSTVIANTGAVAGAVPSVSHGASPTPGPGPSLASRRERLCSLVEHVLAHRSNNTHSSSNNNNKNNSNDNGSGDSGNSGSSDGGDGGDDGAPTSSKPTSTKPRSRPASMPRLPDSTNPLDVHIMQCLLGQTGTDAGTGTVTGSNGSVAPPPSQSSSSTSSSSSSLLLLRELRGYQWEGVSWLTHLRRCGLGGIVAGETESDIPTNTTDKQSKLLQYST